jgi:hypothetical protein
MPSPHPTEGKCLHQGCGGPLTDIWAEFLENATEKAAMSLGKVDFTCPYCNSPLHFDPGTNRGRGKYGAHRKGERNVSTPFSPEEVSYLLAWAREDHLGLANGPARTLQRQHGVQAAVVGQLFARLSTVTGRTQYEMVEAPAPATPITWPWPTQEEFEARLKELLPESTVHYLEELGALAATEVSS